MMYKIVKYQDADQTIVYTLCEEAQEEDGETILVFQAESYEQASFIKNQFLHFEPYRPFDPCWLAEVRHVVTVAHQPVKDQPHEIRTMLVIAEDESAAIQKIKKEAHDYSEVYQNGNGEDVQWKFEKILSIREVDFFSTIDLYKGVPVEIKSQRVSQ